VVAHFTRLAAESPVPLVVYNIPYRTGRVLSAGTLLRLASVPGVIGVKHAVGAVDQDTVLMMAGRPAGFAVLAGDDVFASPLLALGAAGGILASAHVRTAEFARMIAAWHSGQLDQARELGHRLAPLSAALFAEPNPVVIKGALHALGQIPSPAVRLPLLPASRDAIIAALAVC
jgi:4-hydroxy-tetrahydrodipicolinate synthase